jgi:ketosteroid isomerase-like protein
VSANVRPLPNPMRYALLAISVTLTFQFAQAQIAGADKTPATASAGVNSVEDTLIQIEDDWADALVKRDLIAWSRCLGEDWIGTGPDGSTVTKAGAYADLKAGLLVRELFQLDDLKVRVYGDTAIVFGLETEKSKIHGKDMSGQYRFTDVFVKRDGQWQAVASHLSRVSPPK